jgi:hypothetical protein
LAQVLGQQTDAFGVGAGDFVAEYPTTAANSAALAMITCRFFIMLTFLNLEL